MKSKNILKIIFYNVQKRRKLQFIKDNKKAQYRLNISVDDYDDICKTEIDIISEPNKYLEIINTADIYYPYYHLYFRLDYQKQKMII